MPADIWSFSMLIPLMLSSVFAFCIAEMMSYSITFWFCSLKLRKLTLSSAGPSMIFVFKSRVRTEFFVKFALSSCCPLIDAITMMRIRDRNPTNPMMKNATILANTLLKKFLILYLKLLS